MKKHDLWVVLPACIALINLWETPQSLTIVRQPPPRFVPQPALIAAQTKIQITEHNLWDKARGKIQLPPPEITQVTEKIILWQLKAVSWPNLAVLKVGETLKTYHRGDTLPDGAYLQQVLIDGITVKREQTTEHVYLFGKKP